MTRANGFRVVDLPTDLTRRGKHDGVFDAAVSAANKGKAIDLGTMEYADLFRIRIALQKRVQRQGLKFKVHHRHEKDGASFLWLTPC